MNNINGYINTGGDLSLYADSGIQMIGNAQKDYEAMKQLVLQIKRLYYSDKSIPPYSYSINIEDIQPGIQIIDYSQQVPQFFPLENNKNLYTNDESSETKYSNELLKRGLM